MTRVLVAGLLAGVLDIVYAFVLADMRGGTALRTLQSIASGLLGRDAYKGGFITGALGLALHLAPLSAVPFHIAYTPMVILQGFVSHALLVGLPIALCVRRS